jgi:putative membrane protein
MKVLFTLAAGASLLTACNGNTADQTAETDVATKDAAAVSADPIAAADAASADAPADAAGYAAKAGAGDMWEIESSRALLAKSDNADLKKFAQMMIDHHTKSTGKVKAAAQRANITLAPPAMDNMQQQMLNEIKNADAATIDQVYIKHQRTAHGAALKLHQGYAANGENADLKKTASEIAPVVQRHIAELGKMAQS